MREYHVLNLGAGVQSTALYLLAREGKLRFDAAIFADTGDEPAAVYRHLDWLRSLGDPPIWVRSRGRLGDALLGGVNATGQRFVSIPAFVAEDHATRPRFCAGVKAGMVRRQCTREFKIAVVEKAIRYELVGLKPRQRMPKDVRVIQHFGITTDERRRADKAKKRFDKVRWATPSYPFIEWGWSRQDCVAYLKDKVPHAVPKSACVFCPYRDNNSWEVLKLTDPEGWRRAVDIDRALREDGTRANKGLRGKLYLHRSCVPLPMVEFDSTRTPDAGGVGGECEGMCGF